MTKTIVANFRRVDGDDPDSDVAKWLSSVPDQFDAPQARDAAMAALADANARIAKVRDAYHGTLPPAPWPADPQLVKAMEAMAGARDVFTRIASTKVPQRYTKSSKAWLALSRAGVDLFEKVDRLEQRSAAAPTVSDMLKLVPDPSKLIMGRYTATQVAIAGALLYFGVPRVRRFVRRTLALGK